jgi:uracil-DNA glycosylase family 4
LGIDLFEDCLNINAVNCRPEGNRTPKNHEIDCCRHVIVSKVIKEYKPDIIVLLGNAAIYSFLGHRWKKDLGGITKWRGWAIPDRDYNAWVCPTFHPSYVGRDESGATETIWRQDLERVFDLVGRGLPPFKQPKIHSIEDLSPLDNIRSEMVAVDYETTGLKPHAKGHRILCGAVAWDKNNVYTFKMPESKKEKMPLIRLLENPDIGKVAANLKFEDHWSWQRLHRTKVRGWVFDTMLASHLLDNRQGISSLKFQTYTQLGVIDYDSEISPYLKSKETKNANAFNRIWELVKKPGGWEKLMTYCALDAAYELRIAEMQIDEIEYDELMLPF